MEFDKKLSLSKHQKFNQSLNQSCNYGRS